MSAFWDTVVFQACTSEPAVLHAVLALSSAHRGETSDLVCLGAPKVGIPGRQEQFTLRQYGSAISHLHSHIAARDKSSVRVALMTCLLFIYMEFLRGRYASGNAHLQMGLKLLGQSEHHSGPAPRCNYSGQVPLDPIDYSIVSAFAKLQVQSALFGHGSRHLLLAPLGSDSELSPPIFCSLHQARQILDRLIIQSLQLVERCQRAGMPQDAVHNSKLLDDQQRIQAELLCWVGAYHISKVKLQAQMTAMQVLGYRLLLMYHAMAKIMSGTCLSPTHESSYDFYTDHFIFILAEAIGVRTEALSPTIQNLSSEHGNGISRSISDIAVIPALYYTALKCRNHRIRLQALRILDLCDHKEGVWHPKTAACVAQEVMRLEEGCFYNGFERFDDFSPESVPGKEDISLPVLPEWRRIREVEVVVPDDTMGNIIFRCRRRNHDGGLERLIREYDFASRIWKDSKGSQHRQA
jgi:hypothetical protein